MPGKGEPGRNWPGTHDEFAASQRAAIEEALTSIAALGGPDQQRSEDAAAEHAAALANAFLAVAQASSVLDRDSSARLADLGAQLCESLPIPTERERIWEYLSAVTVALAAQGHDQEPENGPRLLAQGQRLAASLGGDTSADTLAAMFGMSAEERALFGLDRLYQEAEAEAEPGEALLAEDPLHLFAAETRARLDTLSADIASLRASPTDPHCWTAVRRTFHAIKGGAALLPIPALERVTKALQFLIDEAQERERLDPALIELLEEGHLIVESWIDGLDPSLLGETRPRIEGQEDLERRVAQAKEHLALTQPFLAQPQPPSTLAGISHSLYAAYVLRLPQELGQLHAALMALRAALNDATALAEARRALHGLKSRSSMVQILPLVKVAGLAEDLLEAFAHTGNPALAQLIIDVLIQAEEIFYEAQRLLQQGAYDTGHTALADLGLEICREMADALEAARPAEQLSMPGERPARLALPGVAWATGAQPDPSAPAVSAGPAGLQAQPIAPWPTLPPATQLQPPTVEPPATQAEPDHPNLAAQLGATTPAEAAAWEAAHAAITVTASDDESVQPDAMGPVAGRPLAAEVGVAAEAPLPSPGEPGALAADEGQPAGAPTMDPQLAAALAAALTSLATEAEGPAAQSQGPVGAVPVPAPSLAASPVRPTAERRTSPAPGTAMEVAAADLESPLARLATLEALAAGARALVQRIGEIAMQERQNVERLDAMVVRLLLEREELRRRNRLLRERLAPVASSGWDELEIESYEPLDQTMVQLQEIVADGRALSSELHAVIDRTGAGARRISSHALGARQHLLGLRRVPLQIQQRRLEQIVMSTSSRLGRQARLVMDAEVLLDREVAEALEVPLQHLVRNAVYHGVEEPADRRYAGKDPQATISMVATESPAGVRIEVRDDGRGIDVDRVVAVAIGRGVLDQTQLVGLSERQKLDLIFVPGLSTADTPSDLAGRGVGLDAVLAAVRRIRGDIEVQTEPHRGTIMVLRVPRSLANALVVIVRQNEREIAIPFEQVEDSHEVHPDRLLRTGGGRLLILDGRVLPVHEGGLLETAPQEEAGSPLQLLEIRTMRGPVGVLVSEVLDVEMTLIEPVPRLLRGVDTLLGFLPITAGKVCPLVDAARLLGASATVRRGNEDAAPGPMRRRKHAVLVVDDSTSVRRHLCALFQKAGFATREAAAGVDALQDIARRGLPDLITLDVEMPGMDGMDTLNALRQAYGHQVPIFMVTSRAQDRHRDAARALGATRYFNKPFNPDEVIGAAELELAGRAGPASPAPSDSPSAVA